MTTFIIIIAKQHANYEYNPSKRKGEYRYTKLMDGQVQSSITHTLLSGGIICSLAISKYLKYRQTKLHVVTEK